MQRVWTHYRDTDIKSDTLYRFNAPNLYSLGT